MHSGDSAIEMALTQHLCLRQNQGNRRRSNKSISEIASELVKISDTPGLLRYWGYPLETHTAHTIDGWELDIFRIPFSPFSDTPKKRHPILLYHGLSTTSAIWLCHPSRNLALYLSNLGFDVFLANFRGSIYTRHKHLGRTQLEFWDFSIDDLQKDVEAVVNHILQATEASQLIYLGFSQGTAACFLSLAKNKALNAKIAAFIAMAPAIKPQADFFFFSKLMVRPNLIYQVSPHSFFPISLTLRNLIPASMYQKLISFSMSSLFGWNHAEFHKDARVALYSHLFGDSSTKVYAHWFQILHYNEFVNFNDCRCMSLSLRVLTQSLRDRLTNPFREKRTKAQEESQKAAYENPMAVKSKCACRPSKIPTDLITAPTYLFFGSEDQMTDESYFRKNVSGIKEWIRIEGYDHMDFVWSERVEEKVWIPMMDILDRLESLEEKGSDDLTPSFIPDK